MLVYYFVPFIVSNRYLLFWVSNGHNSVTVQNRTHVYVNFFDHKDLGNHLLQLCPKVVKHPVYSYYVTVTGIANAMGWFIWCFYYWKSRPYVWRCALFVLLVGVCMIFEVMDFPPVLWIIDAHSLWHLATAGLPFIFYQYVYRLMTVCTDTGIA